MLAKVLWVSFGTIPRMREIEPNDCNVCGEKILRSSVVWGLEGERRLKRVVIILQSSDEREGASYEQALWQSKTGRLILKVVGGIVSDVVITNAVKCLLLDRYKTPSAVVVGNCRSHLAEMVDKFPRSGVLCVGSVALAAYAPHLPGNLQEHRGKIMTLADRHVLAVGHFGRSVTHEEVALATEFIRALRSGC